jgi:hypothetical protein
MRRLVKEGVLASGSWKLFVRRPERVGRALGFNNLLGWRVRVWGVTRQTTAVRLQVQKKQQAEHVIKTVAAVLIFTINYVLDATEQG